MSLSKSASKSVGSQKSTARSPFQVPPTNRLFLQNISDKGQGKEQMRDYLSLPIGEKSARSARVSAKQEKARLLPGGEEEPRGPERDTEEQGTSQIKDTAARGELRRVMRRRENITKDSKHDFMSMERQKALLELSIVTKTAEIDKMDRAIAKEEKVLKRLEAEIEVENKLFEEHLKEHEKKSVEARALFEREARASQQKTIETKKLMAEIATTESDLEKLEDTLLEYRRYRDLLFKLSPPEWQEAQLKKAKTQTDLTEKDSEGKALAEESLTQSDTEPHSLRPECDLSQFEENPELFFTDPQQLQDLLTELTEQNLSLMRNTAREEKRLEEVRANVSKTRLHIEEDEALLDLQIDSMKKRLESERSRGNKLRQKVQLHVSLNSQDQDVLLEALGEKVSQVYRSCVDDRESTFSTLEKLTHIERRVSELQQSLETIPEDRLNMIRRIKESEKRARQREEKLREQQEKQEERMRRYLERSMSEPKKVVKKKLMPRSVPKAQKTPVSKVEGTSVVDEIQKYLFPSDDSD